MVWYSYFSIHNSLAFIFMPLVGSHTGTGWWHATQKKVDIPGWGSYMESRKEE